MYSSKNLDMAATSAALSYVSRSLSLDTNTFHFLPTERTFFLFNNCSSCQPTDALVQRAVELKLAPVHHDQCLIERRFPSCSRISSPDIGVKSRNRGNDHTASARNHPPTLLTYVWNLHQDSRPGVFGKIKVYNAPLPFWHASLCFFQS